MEESGNGFQDFMQYVDSSNINLPTNISSQSKNVSAYNGEHDEEELKEREAMMKTYHVSMKHWFRDTPSLIEKYGQFPMFWQDLKTWEPYREVFKLYLKQTEGTSVNNAEQISDAAHAEAKEKPRRRKSRWGDPIEENDTATDESKRKKSRWAPPSATLSLAAINDNAAQSAKLRSQLEIINQRLATVAIKAAMLEKDPNRSPSPPPQYDSNGKRVNTREVRMRETLERSRQAIVEELLRINPLFKPPSDYSRQKLNRKIYIPIKDFPNYNFIGLIIGPRGNTQKRMERETNCKIAIRGRGSIKEGSKAKKLNADDNDDLHVLITGDRDDELDRAADEIRSLLVPVDDTKNSHKQKQLRELALINGTLRDDDYCHICGEKGHRQWECPNREQSFKPVAVKCAICGDSSHPTRDCTQKKKTVEEAAAIDKEYMSFMQQLGEKSVMSVTDKIAQTAPWLQPAKTVSSGQPWSQAASGPPGVAFAPPGTEVPIAPSVGSTPATAYPPPGSTPATAYPPPGSTPATAFPPPAAPPVMQDYSQMHGWDMNMQQYAGYYYSAWNGMQAATEYQCAPYTVPVAPPVAMPGTSVPTNFATEDAAKQ